MECKDSAYIAKFQKLSDVPEEVRRVNEAFTPILASYGYRSAFSTEVRITEDGESYFIDPTCRFPSPPSQLMCEMIGNLGEIIYSGANGILVEPEQVAQLGAQAIFKVDRDEWSVFQIPEEIDQFVKISFSCKIDGKICVPPDPMGVKEIGWCVGIGDTIEEAIGHLREVKDQMPDGCKVQFDSLADLLKEMQAAKELGMKMTDEKIPEPSSIIEES
jgi:predicted RNase H-like HicB family nuclease